MTKAGGYLGILAVLVALAATVAGGALYEGYDHQAQYISELGATGAPNQAFINYGGFLPVGALLSILLVAVFRVVHDVRTKVGIVLLFGMPIAYIVAAFAPCDPGCAATGSMRQTIHNYSGLLEYAVAPIGIFLVGISKQFGHVAFRGFSVVVTLLVWGVLAWLFMGAEAVGLWQRVAESALFLWMAWLSIMMIFEVPLMKRKSRILS